MSFPVVVFFHQVLERERGDHSFFRNSPTFDQFRSFALEVQKRYRIIGMEEFYDSWKRGRTWPRHSVMITFDDGFKNNLRAGHILHELGIEATFFVISDVVDCDFMPWYMRFAHILSTRCKHKCQLGGTTADLLDFMQRRQWVRAAKEHLLSVIAERRDELLDGLADQLGSRPIDPADTDYAYFSSEDIRELRRLGMVVGCHSATHTNLARCNADQLRREIVESREKLSGVLGEPVDFMSYPDGRFNDAVLDLTSKHYRFAFAANWRYAPDSPWRYPRRGTDGHPSVLSPWYPFKRRFIDTVKKRLGL